MSDLRIVRTTEGRIVHVPVDGYTVSIHLDDETTNAHGNPWPRIYVDGVERPFAHLRHDPPLLSERRSRAWDGE